MKSYSFDQLVSNLRRFSLLSNRTIFLVKECSDSLSFGPPPRHDFGSGRR